MAVSLQGSTWILPAADVSTSTVVDSRRIFVKSIRWDDATTANHKAVLKDQKGNIFWQSTAGGDNNEDAEIIELWVDGLIFHTCDSGTVLVRLG